MILHFGNTNSFFSRIFVYMILGLLSGFSTLLFIHFDLINILPLNITQVNNKSFVNRGPIYYDIDGNNMSEVFLFKQYSKQDVIEYYDENENFVDVIRIRGTFLNRNPSFIFGDFDNDNYSEIYLFSVSNDSVLLNGFELLGDDGHFLKNYYIDSFSGTPDKNDIAFINPQFFDINDDNFEDLVFILRAGYSKVPRKIYTINLHKKVVSSSVNCAAGFNTISIEDLPDFKGNVIFTSANAIENYAKEENFLFNDNSGWLIMYNGLLNDTLFVKEYPHNKSFVSARILETNGGPKIFSMVIEYKTGRCSLERINFDGEVEKSILVCQGTDKYFFLNTSYPEIGKISVLRPDTLFLFDKNLTSISIISNAGVLKSYSNTSFIKPSQQNNFMVFGKGDQLVLRDSGLSVAGTVNISGLDNNLYYNYSIKVFKSKSDYTACLSIDDKAYYIKVEKNAFYNIRFLLIGLVYFGFYLFFYLVFRIQEYFYNKRYMTQSKILALQLQSVQNQLQPHFTFNVLNTIGSMIYQNEKEQAYEYLNYFSDMLRNTLLSGSNPVWQIGEELEFITTYIEMENLRYGSRFKYLQHTEQVINLKALIPKMMIQSFVENSIKHGLLPKKGECCLMVNIHHSELHLIIEVEDNGIGRAASRNIQRQQIGLGTEIIRDYMQVYNKNNRTKFKFTIKDLIDDEGNAAGTKVVISIPNDFRSKLPQL